MSGARGHLEPRAEGAGDRPLVLASASPRRTALLAEWGLAHRIVAPAVDETFEEGLPAADQAARLAVRKAEHVRDLVEGDALVLAADTIVVSGDRQLAKPEDDDDALAMLMSLSGREIAVVTGVALAARGEPTLSGAETTILVMRAFDREEAAAYVATGEPRGKAGAFAIQGEGGRLIADCRGSFSNVVGLPRGLVLDLLGRRGRTPGGL